MTGFEFRLWRRGLNWTQERAAFICDNSQYWPVRLNCRVLNVHPGEEYRNVQVYYTLKSSLPKQLS